MAICGSPISSMRGPNPPISAKITRPSNSSPDKKSYQPGETAHVLAILPTDNAHLLVSTELSKRRCLSSTLVRQERTIVLDIPIQASFAPNVFLNVSYVSGGDMYSSDQRLGGASARQDAEPRNYFEQERIQAARECVVHDSGAKRSGAPVSGAEVSLGVVDEAIYSVAPDYSGNIKSEFYGMRYNSVETHLSINYSFTGYAGDKPIDLAQEQIRLPTCRLQKRRRHGPANHPEKFQRHSLLAIGGGHRS